MVGLCDEWGKFALAAFARWSGLCTRQRRCEDCVERSELGDECQIAGYDHGSTLADRVPRLAPRLRAYWSTEEAEGFSPLVAGGPAMNCAVRPALAVAVVPCGDSAFGRALVCALPPAHPGSRQRSASLFCRPYKLPTVSLYGRAMRRVGLICSGRLLRGGTGFAPANVAVRTSWSVRSRAMSVRSPVTITEARSRPI